MDEVWAGDVFMTFDGTVLELFGFPHPGARFHMKNIELSVGDPDRKERRPVSVKPASYGGGCQFAVAPEDWPSVGPFLDRVLAAIPDV
jgi:hypothetical protein